MEHKIEQNPIKKSKLFFRLYTESELLPQHDILNQWIICFFGTEKTID